MGSRQKQQGLTHCSFEGHVIYILITVGHEMKVLGINVVSPLVRTVQGTAEIGR